MPNELGFLYPSFSFILSINKKKKQLVRIFVRKQIDKRMFDMYNQIIEQMFGTVVRGGFTNEKRESTAEKI